jgi:hypothetical protein
MHLAGLIRYFLVNGRIYRESKLAGCKEDGRYWEYPRDGIGYATDGSLFSTDDISFGMGLAVFILIWTLNPGKMEDLIQFSTAWYLQSVYSNIYHASAFHQTLLTVMAQGTTRIGVTNCPWYSYWFEHFMCGVHKQMGEEVRLDYALSVKVLQRSKRLVFPYSD